MTNRNNPTPAARNAELVKRLESLGRPSLDNSYHELQRACRDAAAALQSHEAPAAATLSESDDAYATALRCAWDCWTTRTEKDLAAFDFSLQHAVGILQMAALSAPAGADWRVPDGYKLVPVEPTLEMIDAACKARHGARAWNAAVRNDTMHTWVTSHRGHMRDILRAALNAAPEEPA